jgi:hypothetical protein
MEDEQVYFLRPSIVMSTGSRLFVNSAETQLLRNRLLGPNPIAAANQVSKKNCSLPRSGL